MNALIVKKNNITRKKDNINYLLESLNKHKISYTVIDYNEVEDFYKRIHNKDYKNKFNILVSFGGDGTILKSARIARKLKIPILGVNAGTIGFLTAVNDLTDIDVAIKRIVKKEYNYIDRSMLDVKVYRDDKIIFNSYAVNEATITTINISKISKYKLFLGKENNILTELSADGVIIATPTGSTAHSFSAGGPIVLYDVNCFIITPICPFTLNQRSYVVNSKKSVNVEVLNNDQFVDIDGRINCDLLLGDRVVITELKNKVKYIAFDNNTFFENIRNKIKAL